MKLLLDENLPHQLRRHLPGHEVFTVTFMGWDGIENGELLSLAAAEGFDAHLIKDASISYQQNAANLPRSVVFLDTASNSIKRFLPLMPELMRQLDILKPRTFVRIRL